MNVVLSWEGWATSRSCRDGYAGCELMINPMPDRVEAITCRKLTCLGIRQDAVKQGRPELLTTEL